MKIPGVDDFFHVLLDDWKEDEMKKILIKFENLSRMRFRSIFPVQI